jgi:hypothetical protein
MMKYKYMKLCLLLLSSVDRETGAKILLLFWRAWHLWNRCSSWGRNWLGHGVIKAPDPVQRNSEDCEWKAAASVKGKGEIEEGVRRRKTTADSKTVDQRRTGNGQRH